MIYRTIASRLNSDLATIRSLGQSLTSDDAIDCSVKALEKAVQEAVAKAMARTELGCTARGIPREQFEPVIKMLKAEIAGVEWSEFRHLEEHSVAWAPGTPLKHHVTRVIYAALGACSGNRTHTARMLGVSLRTVRNWMARAQRSNPRVKDMFEEPHCSHKKPGGTDVAASGN